MEIITVPDGEIEESFIKCRIQNLERILDLYDNFLASSYCYDTDTQLQMASIELAMVSLFEKMKKAKI